MDIENFNYSFGLPLDSAQFITYRKSENVSVLESDADYMGRFISKLFYWEDIIVAVYLIITVIVSLMLNSLVIIICLKRRSHLVSSDYFIVNLAVCDLILSVIGLPFGITSSFTHKWLFGSHGCQAYGFMGFFCGVVSISTLAMMSFSRYINVCKMNKATIVSKYTWLLIVSSYVYASMWAFTPVLGWGSYGVEPYGTSCTIQWNRNKGFVTLMLLLCILLPVVIMKCCYGSVYVYLRRNSKTFKQQQRCRAKSNIKKREGYLLKMTFTMCVGYIATWSLYAVVSFWTAYGEAKTIPVRLTLVAVLIAKSSTFINPSIYFLLNKKFRPHVRTFFVSFFEFRHSGVRMWRGRRNSTIEVAVSDDAV